MTDLTFNHEEIDRLTRRLGDLAVGLTPSEWALLLAIFAAAADKVVISPDEHSGTLPAAQISGDGETIDDPARADARALRQQLLGAYTPGKTPPQGFGESVTP